MKTLNQFKAEQGINAIELLQGKGRKYASVNDVQLVVSSKCDLGKPTFVIPLSQPIDATKPMSPENSQVVEGAFLLINSAVKAVEVI